MIRIVSAAAVIALMTAVPAFAAEPDAAPAAGSADLTLTFEVGAETGRIMVVLFDSEAAYGGQGAPVGEAIVDVAGGDRVADFPGLKPGAYAAKLFHDVDGDGKMATNPFGMPTEPYGFTNNARGNMGPAGWDRAHVVVEGAVAQTINLK